MFERLNVLSLRYLRLVDMLLEMMLVVLVAFRSQIERHPQLVDIYLVEQL